MTFTYDAAGNRISKTAVAEGNTITTWYVRDGQGNVMGVYTLGDPTKDSGALTQSEVDLYGRSRLGLSTGKLNCSTLVNREGQQWQNVVVRGAKLFELNNHLGNVLVTISDKKLQQTTDSFTVAYYTADVINANDYYSFGMPMPGRTYTIGSAAANRYGFNGKEQDPELKGFGDQYDYGMRMYDPRVGRFLSVNPLFKTYPYYTPYQYASNNPMLAIDVDGLESSNDKNPTQVTEQEVANKQNYIEALRQEAEALNILVEDDKKIISTAKTELLKQIGFDVSTEWLPSRWAADFALAASGTEQPADAWANLLSKSTSDLAKDAAELQKVCAQYESTVNDFKSKLENATSFKTNDGIVLDNLTAAAVAAAGIHKNGKNAFGDWAFYEIKVDGKVLKFGIADASRVRKTGEYAKLPERLAQQLSRIKTKAPELALTYETKPFFGYA